MSLSDVRQAIESRFNTNFTVLPIAWRKEELEPDANESWVRFNVHNQANIQESMGAASNLFRGYGLISIQLFSAVDSNNATDDGYLQDIIDIYQGKSFNDVIIFDINVKDIGRSGSWFQTNILIDFTYDDFVSMT